MLSSKITNHAGMPLPPKAELTDQYLQDWPEEFGRNGEGELKSLGVYQEVKIQKQLFKKKMQAQNAISLHCIYKIAQ